MILILLCAAITTALAERFNANDIKEVLHAWSSVHTYIIPK